jgi:hypothetical protein
MRKFKYVYFSCESLIKVENEEMKKTKINNQ